MRPECRHKILAQAAMLQNALRPGVAALEARTVRPSPPSYRLVKMLRVEIKIPRRERLNHPFDLVRSSATPRNSAPPLVDQTFRPFRLVTIPKPAKMTLAHSQSQSRIHTAQSPMPMTPNRINDPSHPYLPQHPIPPAHRPDKSCATKTGHIIRYQQRGGTPVGNLRVSCHHGDANRPIGDWRYAALGDRSGCTCHPDRGGSPPLPL